MSELTFEASGVAKTAERQMQRWLVAQQVQQGIQRENAVRHLTKELHDYIAISRQTGASGSVVARRLGEQLGWQVFDRELLDQLADRFNLQHAVVENVDETTNSWLWEAISKWLDHRVLTQSEYVAHLGKIVLMAAHHGNAIFVGRGAQFLLPRERGLTVRIIAPLQQRIKRIMAERDCSDHEAALYIDRTDRGRFHFVQQYFHHDVDDHSLYDVVIDMNEHRIEDAIELLMQRCDQRFPAVARG